MIYSSFFTSVSRPAGMFAAGVFLLALVFATPTFAQEPAGPAVGAETPAAASDEKLSERVRQLEAQLVTMQAELERMKQAFAKQATPQVEPAEIKTAAVAAKPSSPALPAAVVTAQQPQTQQKQTGIDLGSVRLTPYGTIYFNAFNNSHGVNNQDVPLFAAATGQGGTSASGRQTRLGLRFEGARALNANVSGVIEADFSGGYPAVGIGENFGIVRIRLANAKLAWEKTSVTVGQDWMPFAPVNPTSIAAAAIPQLAAAGNPWARIPQVRVDHKLNSNVTVSAAVLAPQTGDHPSTATFFLQPNTGAASRVPFFQSRIAYADTDWFATSKAGSIGISGHYGRSRPVALPGTDDLDSFGLALDWNFPLHKRVTLAGEAFFGRNLGGFQAGVFQGVNAEFAYRNGAVVIPAGARGIGTAGGWTQIGFTPDVFGDRWSIYGSVGLDDPRDEDLTSVSRFNFRTRNLAYALNTIFKVTPQFWIGAEVRRFETGYFVTGKRTSTHTNLGATYSF